MLMGMMLHGGHCTVCMGEERVGGRSWRLIIVRRAVGSSPGPWGLVVYLTGMLMGGKLVGNARGLLRIVHGIGRESRQSEKDVVCRTCSEDAEERRGENDYEHRERRGNGWRWSWAS